ncbi:hypothetical protein HYX07_01740 [Candidatus Woesearchaeota archaeon]|nr:hypothetical protein [Candidatus Woesearchaeota archaeon]
MRQPPYGNMDIAGVDEVADLIIEEGNTSTRLALNVLKVAILDCKQLEGRIYNAKLEKK